jgi:soluble lytic murein transglycosylase
VIALLGVAGLTVLAVALIAPVFHDAVKEVVLPLRHEDIIRQQAHDKRLDPALVAAVIYSESRFRDQTSRAGAKGLMQITPETAKFIEHLSGGSTFQLSDLSTPQVNIAYGTYYLRYLLNRYGGNEALALAAYNGGEGNVDRWVDAARQQDKALTIDAIPFGETRAYVRAVESAKRQYRDNYKSELGL